MIITIRVYEDEPLSEVEKDSLETDICTALGVLDVRYDYEVVDD